MDIIGRIHEQEEIDALLLREEFGDMTDTERKNIMQLQDEALEAYERVDAPGMQWQCMQAAMLAQIALELSQLVKFLEAISRRVEEV